MDLSRFDTLVRTLGTTSSRRTVLRALVGVVLAGLGLVGAERAGAAGCRAVGKPCSRKRQCCSGVCKRSRCRAHNVGTCDASTSPCGAPACNNRAGCSCFITTGGATFCSAADQQCANCVRDNDCVASMGPGAACVDFANGGAICGSSCAPSHRACAPACAPPL